jgi:tRNA pseudouridine38-40 synthase
MKYLCEVRYVGTHFHGFQVQPNKRTVQGVLCEAAKAAFECPVRVTGCSRTDSGVHAEGFCLTLEPEDGVCRIPPEKLPLAMRTYLPPDLSVARARLVEDGFHPRYDAVKKEYTYKIYAERVMDPFLYQRVWHMPIPFLPDALERMNRAAADLVGTHDFSAFRTEGSDPPSLVRTIDHCAVRREGSFYVLSVAADGFLYNMVRIITGTLVAVGIGHLESDAVKKILESRDRSQAGPTAPPDGLYLSHVFYREEDFLKQTR